MDTAVNNVVTLGEEIDALYALKREKTALEKLASEKDKEITEAEQKLLARMDAEEVSQGGGRAAAVAVDEPIYPSVKDWDSFYAFIMQNRYWHLLERRPSVAGCREIFENAGGMIPGVEPFKKRRLRVRPLG